jgi:hypothetical protein
MLSDRLAEQSCAKKNYPMWWRERFGARGIHVYSYVYLVGGLEHLLFSPILGMMI